VERERLNSWQIALRGSGSPSRLLKMYAGTRIRDIGSERERRRAARELIGEYHEAELHKLLDHVRQGFRRLDAGEIDPFSTTSSTATSARHRSCGAFAAPADPAGSTPH
jgi:hypothetical protein